jgi:hypothetical protein
MTRRIAALRPSWGEKDQQTVRGTVCPTNETTSFTPFRPRRTRSLGKLAQEGSASDGPMCGPTISRRPSVFTAMAIIAATETILPPSRALRWVASSQGRALSRHWSERHWRAPVALERSLREGADPLVTRHRPGTDGGQWLVLAQLRDLALADPAEAQGLDQVVDLPRRDPGDPRLPRITGTKAFSVVFPASGKGGK